MSRFLTNLLYKSDAHRPTLTFSDSKEFEPLGKPLSLTFDLSERFCTGWHDIATGEDHPCPEQAQTDKKYSVCAACQKRTGFNPAFYHAAKVSPQQEARNAEPHYLYLAFMGENYIKVGISWQKRGIKRLLDQGARAGLILQTFPTALIARQYEAKIAGLDGLHETTPTRTKLALLNLPFDEPSAKKQLLAAKGRINDALSASFSGHDVMFFDRFYTQGQLTRGEITPVPDPRISGVAEAVIGDILITRYNGRRLALPLKQYIGYQIELSEKIIPLDLEPEQMPLF